MKGINTLEANVLILNNEIENFPFMLKRIYWISGVPDGTIRGTHAHRECEEVIYILNGCVEVELVDKNGHRSRLTFSAGQYLYIPVMVWKTITFYQEAILIVYASTEYDPKDYIYEHEFFKEFNETGIINNLL